jgi:hypothetical protein
MEQRVAAFFGFEAARTNLGREVLAGLTTFVTMAYIVAVNPAILKAAGIPEGPSMVATVMTAMFGTLVMGLYANRPFAIAPYMGENAFVAYTVVRVLGFRWQAALAAVFVAGVLFALLTIARVRQWMTEAVPPGLRFSFAAGIGLFLAFIGLKPYRERQTPAMSSAAIAGALSGAFSAIPDAVAGSVLVFSSCFVIDHIPFLRGKKLWNVLNQRAASVDVQNLQSVADREHRLAHIVGILQQKLVDGVSLGVGSGGVWVTHCAILSRVHVSPAAWQQDAVAVRNELHGLGGGLVERNADGPATSVLDGLFVLRQGAVGVVRVVGLGNRDSDSWGRVQRPCSKPFLFNRLASQYCRNSTTEAMIKATVPTIAATGSANMR